MYTKVNKVIKEVQIPEGITVTADEHSITVKGKLGELKRELKLRDYKCQIKNNKFTVEIEKPTKKQKAYTGTIAAHTRNMILGVQKGHEYKMKIVYKHFPINVSVEGKKVLIKNFTGEKKPRIAKILGNIEVKVQGQEITIKGINLEDAGQTAANIEQITRIRKKDIRIFQDGIFITKKPE